MQNTQIIDGDFRNFFTFFVWVYIYIYNAVIYFLIYCFAYNVVQIHYVPYLISHDLLSKPLSIKTTFFNTGINLDPDFDIFTEATNFAISF